MSPALRGILFDKDGTLFDYAASWSPLNLAAARLASAGNAGLCATLLRLGGAEPESGQAEADSLLAAGNAAEIAEEWVRAGSPFEPGDLTARLDRLFREGAAHMVPVTDLVALFRRLKARDLRLGIASSDGEAAIADAAGHFGIAPFLDFIAGYDSGFGYKPGPGMARAFCEATGLEPRHAAMVGDNRHDMEMGRSAGFGLCVGVLTGTGTARTLEPHCDLCLASIADLETVL